MQSEAGCGEENLRKEEGQVRKAERETHTQVVGEGDKGKAGLYRCAYGLCSLDAPYILYFNLKLIAMTVMHFMWQSCSVYQALACLFELRGSLGTLKAAISLLIN